MSSVDALKAEGNKAFSAKDYDKAIELFSKALEIDPTNFVLWSNRSAAKAGKRQYEAALLDAEQCIRVNPSWAKGYARKGAALHGQRLYVEAIEAYEAGLKLEDSPALRKGLEDVKSAKEAAGLGKMFNDPNLISKLAANPRTAKHLADPNFMNTLMLIQKNPSLANNFLGSDPRMIDVLGALMGIDMQGFSRPEGSEEMPPGVNSSASSSFSPPPAPKPTSPPPPKPSTSTSEPKDVEMKEEPAEDDEDTKARKEAEAEKKLGAEAYKKRDLPTAETHFARAWEVWPKDITFLTNLAAVYFEQGEYQKAIETCEKAVEQGRELRADYKLVAKAYGRIGTSYTRLTPPDYATAIKFFQKSLTEHRTPDVLNKLRETEKARAEADRLSYVDPALSEAAREEGNKLFKDGDFAGAVKSYTEAIKRDPKDPRGYNNRALAYTKLLALAEALKDTEEAIKVDPKFVKAYIRKSTVLSAMRDYNRALEAVQEATEVDDEGKHTKEIQDQMFKCQQALMAQRSGETEQETLDRAMRDPEVAVRTPFLSSYGVGRSIDFSVLKNIMNDPVMQSILQQAQGNPQALQDHMKNPAVRQKIMKLVNAGIIKTR
ncbi:chaperone [Amylostereum chailletii]|nr:chaperone [Amylostereum chailletii]